MKRSMMRLGRDTTGGAAVVFALTLPVVMGGLGFGTEVGLWYFTQRKLQNAADVAAYAAATEVRAGRDAWARDAAEAAAARTGFNEARGTLDLATPYLGSPDDVEVIVQENLPRLMSALFSSGPVQLRGRAVARITDGVLSCVLALDPAGSGALTFAGNSDTTVTGCNVHTNSLHDDSVMVDGNPEVLTDCVSTAGGIERSRDKLGVRCGRAKERVRVVDDPYDHLVAPAATLSEPCQPTTVFGGGAGATHTISPGRYCGTLEMRRNVTMQPGIYVVDALKVTSTANVVGEGVFIYVQGSGEIEGHGSASIQLSAPETGDYAGILTFAEGSTSSTRHVINGNSTSFFDGVFYAPNGTVDILGNNTAPGGCTQIVAYRIRFTGNSTVDIDCTGNAVQEIRTVRQIRLVE